MTTLALIYLLIAQDGSGYEWEQVCEVRPAGMTCWWSNGPGTERDGAYRGGL